MTDKTEKPAKRGRPSSYSKKISTEICCRLSNGESLRSICSDPLMPSRQSVVNWLAESRSGESALGFFDQYEAARRIGLENMQEEILAIAKDEQIDVPRAKLIIDAMRWFIGRYDPPKLSAQFVGPALEAPKPEAESGRAIALKQALGAWDGKGAYGDPALDKPPMLLRRPREKLEVE